MDEEELELWLRAWFENLRDALRSAAFYGPEQQASERMKEVTDRYKTALFKELGLTTEGK